MTPVLAMAAAALALGASPAPPRSPIQWILGERPAPGAWATYESATRMKSFAGLGEGGADPKEVEAVQKTRVTFLYLGPATVEGAAGEWLEIQEELLEQLMPGMPAPPPGGGGVMVTRVFLDADGKLLRAIVQPPGRPAEETVLDGSTSVAVGALSAFDELKGKLKAGAEQVEVPKLGKVAATTHECATCDGSVKIWRRAADGLCLKVVRVMGDSGRSTAVLASSGSGGKTRIAGPVRKATVDPEIEAFRRMQSQER